MDIVVAAYREQPAQLAGTLEKCLQQSYPVERVYVVDDGSPTPIALPEQLQCPRIKILRLDRNGGVARARNAAAKQSAASLLLFLNVEIELPPTWLQQLVEFMVATPDAGACCGRVRPQQAHRLTSRWRMRFQEAPYERSEGTHEIPFATGHAVLVRRDAFFAVGGYDERLSSTEDAALCFCLKQNDWKTYVVEDAVATSSQVDTAFLLAKKTLRHSGWLDRAGSFRDTQPIKRWPATVTILRDSARHVARNLFRGRWKFLVVDVQVLAMGLQIALLKRKDNT